MARNSTQELAAGCKGHVRDARELIDQEIKSFNLKTFISKKGV
jgi:hypothetical protein